MKVAIIHDWLNTKFGGAENVLTEVASLFPNAPIYTLIYNPNTVGDRLEGHQIKGSFLQRLPRWLQQRSRYLLPLLPTAIEQFDLSEYDVVISLSTGFAKGVITRPDTVHICYCHSPMRFVWDYWPRYVDEQGVGPVRKAAIHRLTSKLRLWDYYSSYRVDRWVANSKTSASRIEKYYRQSVDRIIYPGAAISSFRPVKPDEKEDYFVTLGNLTPYKKIDLAITACNRLGSRLIVIGEGADRERLQTLAGSSIEFAGRVSDERRAELIGRAQALIFPNEEDFGIVPIEAMASGTPVIAYGRGGLTETVIEGKTGRFFDRPTVDSLTDVLKSFDPKKFKTDDLAARAKDFSTERFRKQFKDYIESCYEKSRR